MTMDRPNPATPALIAIDWGTTSMRAFLFAADGSVLEAGAHAAGVMSLPHAGGVAAFDAAFETACGAWLDRWPELPVLAAGMVGSAQGWREAPYANTPVDADALAVGLIRVESARGVPVAIVPGVLEAGSKRLGATVSLFARAWGMMVMAWWSSCRSREIVAAIGDRGHDPSKSIQLYPVDGVGGVTGFSLSATFQGSNSSMREIL